MSFFESIILGIVQGLTEFLPISSTAHLRLVPDFLGWQDPGTEYSAVIQLGTVLSVVIFFWKDLSKLYGSLIKDVFVSKKLKSKDSKLALWILIGTIPICVVGLFLKDFLESGSLRSLEVISFSLIYFGILLYLSEIVSKQNLNIGNLGLFEVLIIGLAQCFALIPGASRSGVTILAGLFIGLNRSDAARFSFLLGVPAIILSGLFELFSLFQNSLALSSEAGIINLLVGILFSFLSGYAAIDFLIKYLQNHKTNIFVIYRVILGMIILLN